MQTKYTPELSISCLETHPFTAYMENAQLRLQFLRWPCVYGCTGCTGCTGCSKGYTGIAQERTHIDNYNLLQQCVCVR